MLKEFKQQLVGDSGIILKIIQSSAKLSLTIEEVAKYLEVAIIMKPVSSDNEANLFFKNIFGGTLILNNCSIEIEKQFLIIVESKQSILKID
jgi:hypothetical protein